MSDYIKREDAIQAVKDNSYSLNDDELIEVNGFGAIDSINELPSADVVEVVRCKDCKYGTWKISKLDNKTKVYECAIHAVFENDFGDNGYCSFGERKEQEHK